MRILLVLLLIAVTTMTAAAQDLFLCKQAGPMYFTDRWHFEDLKPVSYDILIDSSVLIIGDTVKQMFTMDSVAEDISDERIATTVWWAMDNTGKKCKVRALYLKGTTYATISVMYPEIQKGTYYIISLTAEGRTGSL